MTRYEMHANGDCYPPRCVFCAMSEPDVTVAPEDDLDLFQCIHCQRFKSIDERNDYGPDGPGSFCEDCGVGM